MPCRRRLCDEFLEEHQEREAGVWVYAYMRVLEVVVGIEREYLGRWQIMYKCAGAPRVDFCVNAPAEDQTANLNRCLFFIKSPILYAAARQQPSFYSEFRLGLSLDACLLVPARRSLPPSRPLSALSTLCVTPILGANTHENANDNRRTFPLSLSLIATLAVQSPKASVHIKWR